MGVETSCYLDTHLYNQHQNLAMPFEDTIKNVKPGPACTAKRMGKKHYSQFHLKSSTLEIESQKIRISLI